MPARLAAPAAQASSGAGPAGLLPARRRHGELVFQLSAAMPEHVEVSAVQYLGRHDRYAEPLAPSSTTGRNLGWNLIPPSKRMTSAFM